MEENQWKNKGTLKDLLTVKEYEFLDETYPGLCLPEKPDKKMIETLEQGKEDCEIGLNYFKSILSKIRDSKT